MNKIYIPDSKNQFTDANWITYDLGLKLASSQRVNHKLTLLGAFKFIRRMVTYSALGDYVVMSLIVDFFKSKGLKVTELQVKRCIRRFEDYNQLEIKRNRLLTQRVWGQIGVSVRF